MCLTHHPTIAIITLPTTEAASVVRKRTHGARNGFVGFRAFIDLGGAEVYGPFTPSLAAPSHQDVASCHAEVNAVKHIVSMKSTHRKISRASIYITRWVKNRESEQWELRNGVPCLRCLQYIVSHGISKIWISEDDSDTLRRVDVDELKKRTRLSKGTWKK